jgi:hypothetical protein
MASYHHTVKYHPEFGGYWRVCWTVDHHYPSSMLRFPRRHSRDTDEAGARRFAKKHGIAFPEPTK